MAQQISAYTPLGFVFSPLGVDGGLMVEGGIATSQLYDVSMGNYVPDWTMTHVVLRPWLYVTDPDGIIKSGDAEYVNPKWYYAEEGKETLIVSGKEGFTINADGSLSVERNAQPEKVLTIRFEGEYLDSRTGKVYLRSFTEALVCTSVEGLPHIELDCPEVNYYDPLYMSDSQDRTIKATMKIGSTEVDTAKYKLQFEKKDEGDTAFAPVSATELMDYDVTLGADGRTLTIHRDLMGNHIEIRVRGVYDPYGKPDLANLTDASPRILTRFVRKIPENVKLIPPRRLSFDGARKQFYAIGQVQLGSTILPADLVLKNYNVKWAIGTGNAAGTFSGTTVAEQTLRPTLPTTAVSKTYGGGLQFSVSPKDPAAALKDSDGSIVTDSTGEVLLTQ